MTDDNVSTRCTPWPCGVDEAGRGPLAGPVVAAAVIFDADRVPAGVADSKTLSATARESLAVSIEAEALATAIGVASVAEIDQLNILNATMLAMQRAVAELSLQPAAVLVDGNRAPEFQAAGKPLPATAIVGGDASETSIGAASILAKVYRDRLMCELDARFPGYGFARHKGYGTREHREALERLGATPVHRSSFAPVRAVLVGNA